MHVPQAEGCQERTPRDKFYEFLGFGTAEDALSTARGVGFGIRKFLAYSVEIRGGAVRHLEFQGEERREDCTQEMGPSVSQDLGGLESD